MGHYEEKNIKLKVNMEELVAHQTLVFEMVLDSKSGNWELVLVQNANRNMVGIAEFS